MSCQIMVGSTLRDLKDLKIGKSNGSSVDVQKVVRWDNVILWERQTTIIMTSENTTITINPTSYTETGSSMWWGPYRPSVTKVTVNGKEITTNNYEIKGYYNNEGMTSSTVTTVGYVTISGKNGYSGEVSKNFNIKYTYEPEIVYFKVTGIVNPAGYGSITGINSGGYVYGSTCTANAVPADDVDPTESSAGTRYKFVYWNSTTTDKTNPKSFAVYDHQNLTANFTSVSLYKITTDVDETSNYGTTSGGGKVESGGSTTITATPSQPTDQYTYSFKKWDDGSTTASRTLENVTANGKYIAYFDRSTRRYTIYTTAIDGHVSEGGTYDYGTQYSATAKGLDPRVDSPNYETQFSGKWNITVGSSTTTEEHASPWKFNVTRDCTIKPTFNIIPTLYSMSNNSTKTRMDTSEGKIYVRTGSYTESSFNRNEFNITYYDESGKPHNNVDLSTISDINVELVYGGKEEGTSFTVMNGTYAGKTGYHIIFYTKNRKGFSDLIIPSCKVACVN